MTPTHNNEKQSEPSRPRPHTVHVPVMGTGFTIDTPLRIARYGITSVISLVDDHLIEKMRRMLCQREHEPYTPIPPKSPDSRARRITAYLDLVGDLLSRQVENLRKSHFEPGSEITRYFEMLPEGHLRRAYTEAMNEPDPERRQQLQDALREQAVPGNIEVNIMTKLDRDTGPDGSKAEAGYSDALAALRGFAESRIQGAMVFSAGFNRRLYTYAARLSSLLADAAGQFRKHIVLKVSDFRSAVVQGRFFASRGLWIHEFRVESGLNCGGHAFGGKGALLGPILEEFRLRRKELCEELFAAYTKAREKLGLPTPAEPPYTRLTAQGGIGTAEEDHFLRERFDLDGTGWATPFLLVPEAVSIDVEHLHKLADATINDVYLSDSSPLNVPYWNLRTSASEQERLRRIAEGKPGSPCGNGYASLSTELSEHPMCPSSRIFQERKLAELDATEMDPERRRILKEQVIGKACICRDLAGSALRSHDISNDIPPAICCGSSIVHFTRIASLDEMLGHIYGRLSLFSNVTDRPHMFIQEFRLALADLKKEIDLASAKLSDKTGEYFQECRETLSQALDFYRNLATEFVRETREKFLTDLESLADELKLLPNPA